jgi:hypothetical protein
MILPRVSSSGLSRGSIPQHAPALADRWMVGTSPTMTVAGNVRQGAKNFKEADRIRDQLSAMGIQLKDTKDPVADEDDAGGETVTHPPHQRHPGLGPGPSHPSVGATLVARYLGSGLRRNDVRCEGADSTVRVRMLRQPRHRRDRNHLGSACLRHDGSEAMSRAMHTTCHPGRSGRAGARSRRAGTQSLVTRDPSWPWVPDRPAAVRDDRLAIGARCNHG